MDNDHNPNVKGNIAEAAIALAAIKLGIPVLKPMNEHGRYDLGLEVGGGVKRVQCKWGRLADDGSVIVVRLSGSRLTPKGYLRTAYKRGEVDLVACIAGRSTVATFCRTGCSSESNLPTFGLIRRKTGSSPALRLQPSTNSMGL